MKIMRLLIVLAILALAAPASLPAQVTLKNGALGFKAEGKPQSLELPEGAVVPVRGSKLVFTAVNDPAALKAVGANGPALFFFDQGGALTGRYEGRDGFDPEMCTAASLSPGGKVIALDNGTWVVRIWMFLNFPKLTEINPAVEDPFLSYLAAEEGKDLAWVDDDTVIITDISEAPVSRPCPADPCEPLDVVVHRIRDWNSVALAKGSELCDYSFQGVNGRTVTVNKTCTKKIEDWGNPDQTELRTVTRETLTVPGR